MCLGLVSETSGGSRIYFTDVGGGANLLFGIIRKNQLQLDIFCCIF